MVEEFDEDSQEGNFDEVQATDVAKLQSKSNLSVMAGEISELFSGCPLVFGPIKAKVRKHGGGDRAVRHTLSTGTMRCFGTLKYGSMLGLSRYLIICTIVQTLVLITPISIHIVSHSAMPVIFAERVLILLLELLLLIGVSVRSTHVRPRRKASEVTRSITSKTIRDSGDIKSSRDMLAM
jgi:hypothetical protein